MTIKTLITEPAIIIKDSTNALEIDLDGLWFKPIPTSCSPDGYQTELSQTDPIILLAQEDFQLRQLQRYRLWQR